MKKKMILFVSLSIGLSGVFLASVLASSGGWMCTEDVAQTVTGNCSDCGNHNGLPRCPGNISTTRAVSTCKKTTVNSECAEGTRPASYFQTCNEQVGTPLNANCHDLTYYYSCVPGSAVNSVTTSTYCQ